MYKEHIQLEKKKTWNESITTLENNQPYELIEKDGEGHLIIDEIEMEITKVSQNKVKGFFRLGGSAKYWGELFSLHETITSYERAINQLGVPYLQVEETEVEDPNFMYIDFSYTFSDVETIGDIIEETKKIHNRIKEVTYSILLQQAEILLSELKKK